MDSYRELKKNDIVVNHLSEVDFSGIRVLFIAVYDHPLDYPDKVVARIYNMDKPTNVILLGDSEEEITEEIQKETCLVRFERGAGDDPVLICCWG